MAKETVYELFDKFLEKLKKGKSMFSDNEVFTQGNIKELHKRIVENSIGDDIKSPDKHKLIIEKLVRENKKLIDSLDAEKDKKKIDALENMSFNEEDVNFDRKIECQLGVGLFKGEDQADKGVLELFANLLWLRYLPINGIGVETKLKKIRMLFSQEDAPEVNDIFFPKEGVASYGILQQRIFEDLEALIEFFKEIIRENKAVDSKLFKDILQQKVKKSHEDDLKFHERSIINMLQHFCDKEKYVDCASYSHKKEIVKAFEKPLSIDVSKSIDNKIWSIKTKLLALNNLEKTWEVKNEFRSFYHKQIRQFWDFQGVTKEDFSELRALEFKKSIVFYGPPGTSKTHNAKKLAEILIRQAFIKQKDQLKKALDTDFEVEYKNRISNLQLHANYSYEDFIIGMRIEKDNTVWEKGWLLKKIEQINKENESTGKKLPYIIIFDEINRVDLSRLFGELFSAIENRETDVELSALDKDGKRITVNIPSNLYFIGTMNEIDFSLERIDFALRRRFVWYFYGYNKDTLKNIIENKSVRFKDDHLDEFINRATKINQTLEEDEDFGKQWQIGHTFFAEIIEISETVNEKSLFVKPKESKKFTKAKRPVEILWSISIKPMLEAYCGNLDKESKKEKLDGFEDRFLKGVNGK